jgi:chemotaxis protein MotA
MDIATILGIVAGFGLVIGSILIGGPLGAFLNGPGALIVVGGTLAATLVSEKLSVFVGVIQVTLKAFFQPTVAIDKTIGQLADFAMLVRKDGPLALENEEITDKFMAKGVRLAVDGLPPDEVKSALLGEMQTLRQRHRQGQRIFRFMASTAPAMGMVGTLIGLVQMLQTMEDPASIGPSMAVALLTTLYGAVLAFMVFGPIADKLEGRTKDETLNMAVIVAGLEGVLNAENPRIIRDKLEAFLAPKLRNLPEEPPVEEAKAA